MKKFYLSFFFLCSVVLFVGCATYQTQINGVNTVDQTALKEKEHTIYLIGGLGNTAGESTHATLYNFKQMLASADKESTVLFLGDDTRLGLVNDDQETALRTTLQKHLDVVGEFKGQTVFIPGHLAWKQGLKSLEFQQEFIEDKLGKDSFLPTNGCAFDKLTISDQVQLLIIDSQWFLNDWDKFPTINDDCEIRTRAKFFEEIESEIKKARGKTTLIAIHHPMFTNGPYGGNYTFTSHLTPIPLLGSLKNVLRKTAGISTNDTQNSQYRSLIKRVVTLAQENDRVIFLSGHEQNLQFLRRDNLAQIISGAATKTSATRNTKDEFSSSEPGFARLDIFVDGSSTVTFFDGNNQNQLFASEVYAPKHNLPQGGFPSSFSARVTASVYTKKSTKKSAIFKRIWGERYRKYYATDVEVPTVNLDTLHGGLKPIRKGGGHQSKSLRLSDKNGTQYVMRAIKKSAEVYLQAMAFKDQYIMGEFEDTYTAALLEDFYTGSHPYAPFTLGVLSDAVQLYHTNPVLYYVPKQNALGEYNSDFGDELYMIEEHVSEGHNLQSFGYAKKIENTMDLLKKLRKDEKYVVDAAMYLRARLFDMVIGDWDRHVDQWRWAEFEDESTGMITLQPIPRDRDQAYSIMGDGWLMGFATRVIPPLKLMEGFHKEIRNVKSFNASPFSLDMILLSSTSLKQWEEQVAFLQKNLTAAVIDQALAEFPKEMQDETVQQIKETLLARLQDLNSTAQIYYKVLNRNAIIAGTDKDDVFEIERKPDGKTRVRVYRLIKGEKGTLMHDRTYDKRQTKELWIYGLDDQDEFNVYGEGDQLIKIRLIGGQNKDRYTIENGKRIKMYDYVSKKSEFITTKGTKKLTDDYETNSYHYTKFKNSLNQIIPTVGANPDDGFKLGILDTYTSYGFERNPFSSQHNFSAAYYFATNGFELEYSSVFANVIGSWNLGIDLRFTSPNYSVNFFGYGNETINLNDSQEALFNVDYNRVKLQSLRVAPYLYWTGASGAHLTLGVHYASIEVEETQNRFINTFYTDNQIENEQSFWGVSGEYGYESIDNKAYPTLGVKAVLAYAYTGNLDKGTGFSTIVPSLSVTYPLEASGNLVLASRVKAHLTLGNQFEFYQAASIGASDGLRGYRNQRFTGKHAFYQSTDLRVNLTKIKTGLLPLQLGVYGGVDYGRVWLENDPSEKWNNSYGGGLFLNAANVITANFSAFIANEGLRLGFKMGFAF